MLFIDVDVCRIQTHPWLSHTVTMIMILQLRHRFSSDDLDYLSLLYCYTPAQE